LKIKRNLKKIYFYFLGKILETRIKYLFFYFVNKSLFSYKNSLSINDRETILILNQERFENDLNALQRNQRFNMVCLPSRVQSFVNSIFLNSEKRFVAQDYMNSKPEVDRLLDFIGSMINFLDKKYSFIGILSCSFYYRQDYPYEFSYNRTNIPFYVIFKEYMKDEIIIAPTVSRYKEQGLVFKGRKIFCSNASIEKILLESKVCSKKQTSIVGSPRFDSIFYDIKNKKNNLPKSNIITLFSFHHASGSYQLSGEDNFFSNSGDGFSKLFDSVHSTIAELALEHRDKKFIIKTKWDGPWHQRIIDSIMRSTNIDITNQPNIVLTHKGDAQELIKKSKVIVAFNSTTILEAHLLKNDAIIPLFDEAAGKYFNSNLLYKKYLKSLNTVNSSKNLKKKIISQYYKKEIYKINREMIKEYIGFFDGNVSKRILDEMDLIE